MPTENTAISRDQFVPPELWGRDHYSTLAYVETKLVDDKYSVRFDPHMRQNRRNWRVLSQSKRVPLKPGDIRNGLVMDPKYGSRLADDTYLPWHDDWCCVQDMMAAGLFHGDTDDFDAGFQLQLTNKGYAAAAAIREHKAKGGNFSICAAAVLIAIGYQPVANR